MADEAVNTHSDWNALKSEIEHNFQQWLGELTEFPQIDVPAEMPDIYSFYQELCVFRNELRVGGRRNQEVLSRFGESLSGFQKIITGLQNK